MSNYINQQFGNYRLLHLIDSGGFADVYLGEHIYLHTQHAVKVLQMHLYDEIEKQRFLREAQILANLQHPQIIAVQDAGLRDDFPFLAMTYAAHGNLRQRHPEGSRVPLAQVVAYVKQVASGVQYAHDHSIIHRDLKPENLLLGEHDELLLSDFGIAILTRASRSQSLQEVVGTVTYMAPEQIQGHPRPASDQYALAALAYEWLSGTPPFDGPDFLTIARQHLREPLPALTTHVSDLSPAVVAVIHRALAKDYRQRFESIQSFAEALENAARFDRMPVAIPALLNEDPVESAISPERQPRSERRRLLRRSAILLGGGGLVAWAVYGYIRQFVPVRRMILTVYHKPHTSISSASPSPVPTPDPAPVLSHSGIQGQTIATYHGLSNSPGKAPVETIDWSPDGQKIVAGSAQQLAEWNVFTGQSIIMKSDYSEGGARPGGIMDRNNGGGTEQGAAWSPSGVYIASNSMDGTIHIWDAATGADQQQCNGNGSIGWSPNGSYLAVGNSFGNAQVYGIASSKVLATYSGHTPTANPNQVNSLAWSRDGRYLATGGSDGTIQVWEALTGHRISLYNAGTNPNGFAPFVSSARAWSPDGVYLLSCWVDGVHITNAMTGQLIRIYKGHGDEPLTAAWSPDGTYVASGGLDTTVRIWNPATGGQIFTYTQHTSAVTALAWSPDGSFIASGGYDKGVNVWNAR